MPFYRKIGKRGNSISVNIPSAYINEFNIKDGYFAEIIKGIEPNTIIIKFKGELNEKCN